MSSVVLVPKNCQLRFCIDYRQLNTVTKKCVNSLPRIGYPRYIGEAQYFTSLDLASGYWQVELEEGSHQTAAFTIHHGLELVRTPFGLCNAPETIQWLKQMVSVGLEGNSCFVYLDDILIVSITFQEHFKHQCEVFEWIHKAPLRWACCFRCRNSA